MMGSQPHTLDLVAALLEYPGTGWRDRAVAALERLKGENREAAALLGEFVQATEGHAIEQIEELFTRTFDVSPVCCLEIGWHLFGESYDRGEFLVKMRQQLRRFGIEESAELPDHLCHVLPALARMGPIEAGPFAADRVLPAVEKMLVSMTDSDTPYKSVLQALWYVLNPQPACCKQE